MSCCYWENKNSLRRLVRALLVCGGEAAAEPEAERGGRGRKGSPESHGLLWHPHTFRTWTWGRKLPFGSFGSLGCYERCWDAEYLETENAEKYEMFFDCVNITSPLFVLFWLPDSFLGPYRWEGHLLGPIPALSRHPGCGGIHASREILSSATTAFSSACRR